jgi:hypothetical protein
MDGKNGSKEKNFDKLLLIFRSILRKDLEERIIINVQVIMSWRD